MRFSFPFLRHMLLLGGVFLVALGPIGMAPALTVRAAPDSQANTPGVLRLAMPPVTQLDPVQISRFDLASRDLIENLFVGLTRYDPVTQQIEPMLAKDWSISADGLTWTFNLREDVQWVRYDSATQDIVAIRPVMAGDFVYAIQRACDPLRPSPLTTNAMIIKGCQTVSEAFPRAINDIFIAREIGVRATGTYTLEIELLFPAAYLPSLLSTPEMRPLAREGIQQSDRPFSTGAMMTSGPFTITAWTSTGMSLGQNPFWPDSFEGNITQADVIFVDDPQAALSMVPQQDVDLMRLAPELVAAARTSYGEFLRTSPGTSITSIGFSFDRSLMNETDVRRGLALAIDTNALVQQFLPGEALPASQFTPPGAVAYSEAGLSLFNPGEAQAAFNAADHPGCSAIPEKMTLLVPDDDPQWAEIGQFVVQQWITWLGCSPTLFEVKPIERVLLLELSHGAFDPELVTRSHMWLTTWSPDYPDANGWLSDALHCHFGYVRSGRECSEGDTLLDKAALELDPAQRAALYAQAETAFFGAQGSFPVIPLFVTTTAWLQQPTLTNVNPLGAARFDLWTLDGTNQG